MSQGAAVLKSTASAAGLARVTLGPSTKEIAMSYPRSRALQVLLPFALTTIVIGVYAALNAQRGGAPQIQPFKGITANGTLEAGLFPIKATGVSTRPVREAAQRFLQALTEEQRAKTTYAVDDEEWLKWNNVHRY